MSTFTLENAIIAQQTRISDHVGHSQEERRCF